MTTLSLALPGGADPDQRWQTTARAHESFLATAEVPPSGIRQVVLDSWLRSTQFLVDPDTVRAPVGLSADLLAHCRETHLLARVMPMIRSVLVNDADDSDVLVVVGDEHGHALWVEGDTSLRRRTESVNLTAGARWSERDVGTNGIGTALAVGEVVQVFGSEHFSRPLHGLSCTAAPLRDPRTRRVIGFFDISGGPQIATPQAAFLARTAVAAIEAELRLVSSDARHSLDPGFDPAFDPEPHVAGRATLRVLGRDRATLELGTSSGTGTVELGLRHSELLLLLSARPEGVTAGELAWLLYEHDAAEVTIRAEMSRLRKALPGLVAAERPYRLLQPIDTDASEVAEALRRGALGQALDLYPGAVLPRSSAPGIEDLRTFLRGFLRESLLERGDPGLLLRFAATPDGRLDHDVWRACAARLPAGSPERAEAMSMVAGLDRALG